MSADGKRKICPRCNLGLDATTYESVSVDMCGGCWGFWLDQGELQAILASTEEQFNAQEHQRIMNHLHEMKTKDVNDPTLPCLVCATDMKKKTIIPNTGLVIDICDTHGIWMDNGELKAAQIFSEEKNALSFLLNSLKTS